MSSKQRHGDRLGDENSFPIVALDTEPDASGGFQFVGEDLEGRNGLQWDIPGHKILTL